MGDFVHAAECIPAGARPLAAKCSAEIVTCLLAGGSPLRSSKSKALRASACDYARIKVRVGRARGSVCVDAVVDVPYE